MHAEAVVQGPEAAKALLAKQSYPAASALVAAAQLSGALAEQAPEQAATSRLCPPEAFAVFWPALASAHADAG